jgi:hypothetical protein
MLTCMLQRSFRVFLNSLYKRVCPNLCRVAPRRPAPPPLTPVPPVAVKDDDNPDLPSWRREYGQGTGFEVYRVLLTAGFEGRLYSEVLVMAGGLKHPPPHTHHPVLHACYTAQ